MPDPYTPLGQLIVALLIGVALLFAWPCLVLLGRGIRHLLQRYGRTAEPRLSEDER